MSYVARPLRQIRNRLPHLQGLGSNQSMPVTGRKSIRVLEGLGGITGGGRRARGGMFGLVPVPTPAFVPFRKPAGNITLLGGGSGQSMVSGFGCSMGSLGGSLGDDAIDPAAPSIGSDPVVLAQQQLAELQKISAYQLDYNKRESLQRWFQVAATLAIPLSAAVWRAIFKSGGRSTGIDD